MLHAARAAAFLSIATGVNSILTALYPRYEPVYAYLISVVVVAWLSSALLGVTTAVVAVVLYDWMFSPVRIIPSISFVFPLTVAVALAIATRAMKIPVKRRAVLAKPVEPPLLPAVEEPRSVIVRDDVRVAELTQRLAAANARAEDEAALRAEAKVAASAQEAKLENEMEALRQTIAEQNGRWATARSEFEDVIKRVRDTEARLAEAQLEIEAARRKAGQESERAARETMLREQSEAAGRASLQKVIADLSAKYESALAETKQRAEKLQKGLTDLTAKSEAANAKANALQRELDRTLASLNEEHARADREAKLRSQLEAAARQTLQRTANVSAGHQREANEAREAAQTAEQRAAALQKTIDGLQSEVAAVRAQHEERTRELQQTKQALEEEGLRVTFELAARQKMADEAASVRHELERLAGEIEAERSRTREAHAAREATIREADQKLQMVMATKYESAIAQAAGEKEAANAEVRKARQTIEELQSLITEMESQREQMSRDFDANLQKIVAGITADHEHSIGEMLVEREAAKAELRTMNGKLQALREALEDARAHAADESELQNARQTIEELQSLITEMESQREQMSRDFDANLQKIVAGITADHEHSIGEMLVEREAAKAELRTMNGKLQALQNALEEERRHTADEKAGRERLDAEWNEKLQKIVSHLTEDHEADVGEAMLQREAARAEVRSLSARVSALQQKVEEERDRFRQAAERWQRRSSFPPTVEQSMPATTARRHVVLVVHSDAGIRAMAKHSLEQAGYQVITAADGLEGLRTATQRKPDVVLAEAVMPKMNARELVQLLKSRPETANVKIVLISGSNLSEKGTDFRADEVIRDPANFNDLRTTLANVLTS